ncbi:MAG TPA: hypothetical protein VN696_04560 [Pyrinomonadaceae bacterium]|nr:hypothetical protein [Pyrinomonadaceae bacterium]
MFQLLDLILASMGAFIVSALRDTVYAAMIVAECDECGFNDLGKLLFGGLIVAVLIGVGGSLLWRRMKEKNANTSEFVSIKANDHQ